LNPNVLSLGHSVIGDHPDHQGTINPKQLLIPTRNAGIRSFAFGIGGNMNPLTENIATTEVREHRGVRLSDDLYLTLDGNELSINVDGVIL
jgi:hypothetical protein